MKLGSGSLQRKRRRWYWVAKVNGRQKVEPVLVVGAARERNRLGRSGEEDGPEVALGEVVAGAELGEACAGFVAEADELFEPGDFARGVVTSYRRGELSRTEAGERGVLGLQRQPLLVSIDLRDPVPPPPLPLQRPAAEFHYASFNAALGYRRA